MNHFSSAQTDPSGEGLHEAQVRAQIQEFLGSFSKPLHRVLLVPPDGTRPNSKAGLLTRLVVEELPDACHVAILPALGTHAPMTPSQRDAMFGPLPGAPRFLDHHWRHQVQAVGLVTAQEVAALSDGVWAQDIAIELNTHLLDDELDLILSLGQVVPHEVVGMANYTKNIAVGCGGKALIDHSHILGALYGLERGLGRDHTPVRRLFDLIEQRYLSSLPLWYGLTVVESLGAEARLRGVFWGRQRHSFEQAVALSQRCNITQVPAPQAKVVAALSPSYHSTWLGNKAIYRTRSMLADGASLVILAPEVAAFGETPEQDRLIRRFGYMGREQVLEALAESQELASQLGVAAHLIHGATEGRFEVYYATPKIQAQELEAVGFRWLPWEQTRDLYPFTETGPVQRGAESLYFVAHPGAGMWTAHHFEED